MNDKNIIVNKPEPKPGILERGDLFAIAVGMVIGSGMVTLIGPAMAYTGYSVWLAYLTAIVMGFFMVFPYIILGGTMRVAQHHKLKKKMERNLFAGSFHCVKI